MSKDTKETYYLDITADDLIHRLQYGAEPRCSYCDHLVSLHKPEGPCRVIINWLHPYPSVYAHSCCPCNAGSEELMADPSQSSGMKRFENESGERKC